MSNRYRIDGDLGIDYQDQGPWRSYEANGTGNTLVEFYENLVIAEVDQDGGELNCYGIENAPTEVEKAIIRLLGVSETQANAAVEALYEKQSQNESTYARLFRKVKYNRIVAVD